MCICDVVIHDIRLRVEIRAPRELKVGWETATMCLVSSTLSKLALGSGRLRLVECRGLRRGIGFELGKDLLVECTR